MNRVILPHDRPLTPEELQGFRMACTCFETWGAQIAHQGALLAGGKPGFPMQEKGQFLMAIAQAMELGTSCEQRVAVDLRHFA